VDTSNPDKAVKSIGDMGAAGKGDQLVPLISSPDLGIAISAVTNLGRVGDQKAADALVEAIKDPRPEVQSAAFVALGIVKVHVDAAQAMAVIEDTSRPVAVRQGAISMVARREIYHSMPSLVRVLEDKDQSLRAMAFSAICTIIHRGYDGFSANEPDSPRTKAAVAHLKQEIGSIDWNKPGLPE